jgi:hypothetical protein
MLDVPAPPVAVGRGEAVELVAAALSDGDLEAALAQYERGRSSAVGGWRGAGACPTPSRA